MPRRDSEQTAASEDAIYLRAVANGDMHALEVLFQKYQAQIYQTALGVTRDPSLAEEVLQDVFFRLYRHADRLDGSSPLAPWLYRVTINLCYNRLKGLRAWTDSFHELAERLFSPSSSSPERSVERSELQLVVQQALAELDPKHRAVVVLFYLHEYSVQEIAEIVGVPEGTVKSRLFYARKLLRRYLERYDGLSDLLVPNPA
ncbi:RNA polymerase sigma factor [Kallotenue papyrolyticum]|uniref:RNA polymerase sigma factor n=1 Tax=Kallotenue papyrolyticum TaxID=1325125 RepID=UPI0004785EFE|nr:RNA polymerase sigma factor [Kallotenue papyrolyticum]